MSIRTQVAIQLNRFAVFVALAARRSLLTKVQAANREFHGIHAEKRAALALAEKRRLEVIEAAARQAESDREKAEKIAQALELKNADKSSSVQAALFELESNCRFS